MEENNPITLPLDLCSLTVSKCAASKIVMPVYPPWISYKRPTSFPGSLILTPGAPGVKMRDPGNEVDKRHALNLSNSKDAI